MQALQRSLRNVSTSIYLCCSYLKYMVKPIRNLLCQQMWSTANGGYSKIAARLYKSSVDLIINFGAGVGKPGRNWDSEFR